MPTITPVTVPVATGNQGAVSQSPRKSIQATSTGMQIVKPDAQKQGNTGQPDINVETKEKVATLSPALTELSRKEAKFRQEQAQFKQQKAEFEATSQKFAKFKTLDERLSKKDFAALDELGVSFQEWANYLRARQAGTKPEVQKLNQIEEKIKSIESKQEEQVSKQYEATVNQYRNDVKKLVASNPDFSTIKELGHEEFVVQHILDTFEQDDEILTIEEASKDIEDALIAKAEKMVSLTKVKSKLGQPTEKKLPPPRSGLRTLTNELPPANQEVSRKFGEFQNLTPAQRLEQAIRRSQRQG